MTSELGHWRKNAANRKRRTARPIRMLAGAFAYQPAAFGGDSSISPVSDPPSPKFHKLISVRGSYSAGNTRRLCEFNLMTAPKHEPAKKQHISLPPSR